MTTASLRRPPAPHRGPASRRIGALLWMAIAAVAGCTPRGESSPEQELIVESTVTPVPDSLSWGEPGEPETFIAGFPHLKRLGTGWGTILYPDEGTEVINKPRSELPPAHPLYLTNDFSAEDMVLIRHRFARAKGKEYFVVFTEGPSGDPGYYLADAASGEETPETWGEVLAIGLDGEVTMYQRTNSDFPMRKRLTIVDGAFVEGDQTRFVLGTRTIVLDSLRLFRSERDTTIVARLERGDSLVVLEAERGRFLSLWLRTMGGIRGFVRLPSTQCPSAVIRRFCYLGD